MWHARQPISEINLYIYIMHEIVPHESSSELEYTCKPREKNHLLVLEWFMIHLWTMNIVKIKKFERQQKLSTEVKHITWETTAEKKFHKVFFLSKYAKLCNKTKSHDLMHFAKLSLMKLKSNMKRQML